MDIFSLVSISIILNVLIRTLIIFVFAFFVLRLLGKKHLSHLTYLDLLLIISLGSAVGDVMIYTESTVQLFSSMIAITAVGILVKIFNELSSHSKHADYFLTGTARLIIENGEILPNALAQEDMNEEDLMRILREKDYNSIKNIRKAFVEADGEVSVLVYKKNNRK